MKALRALQALAREPKLLAAIGWPWLSLFGLCIGVRFAIAWVLLSMQAQPRQLSAYQDDFYTAVLTVIAAGTVILSLVGSASLKKQLEIRPDEPTGTLFQWVFMSVLAIGAAYLVINAQGLVSSVSDFIASQPAGSELTSVRALRGALAVWALMVAYKLKILWDGAAAAVAPGLDVGAREAEAIKRVRKAISQNTA